MAPSNIDAATARRLVNILQQTTTHLQTPPNNTQRFVAFCATQPSGPPDDTALGAQQALLHPVPHNTKASQPKTVSSHDSLEPQHHHPHSHHQEEQLLSHLLVASQSLPSQSPETTCGLPPALELQITSLDRQQALTWGRLLLSTNALPVASSVLTAAACRLMQCMEVRTSADVRSSGRSAYATTTAAVSTAPTSPAATTAAAADLCSVAGAAMRLVCLAATAAKCLRPSTAVNCQTSNCLHRGGNSGLHAGDRNDNIGTSNDHNGDRSLNIVNSAYNGDVLSSTQPYHAVHDKLLCQLTETDFVVAVTDVLLASQQVVKCYSGASTCNSMDAGSGITGPCSCDSCDNADGLSRIEQTPCSVPNRHHKLRSEALSLAVQVSSFLYDIVSCSYGAVSTAAANVEPREQRQQQQHQTPSTPPKLSRTAGAAKRKVSAASNRPMVVPIVPSSPSSAAAKAEASLPVTAATTATPDIALRLAEALETSQILEALSCTTLMTWPTPAAAPLLRLPLPNTCSIPAATTAAAIAPHSTATVDPVQIQSLVWSSASTLSYVASLSVLLASRHPPDPPSPPPSLQSHFSFGFDPSLGMDPLEAQLMDPFAGSGRPQTTTAASTTTAMKQRRQLGASPLAARFLRLLAAAGTQRLHFALLDAFIAETFDELRPLAALEGYDSGADDIQLAYDAVVLTLVQPALSAWSAWEMLGLGREAELRREGWPAAATASAVQPALSAPVATSATTNAAAIDGGSQGQGPLPPLASTPPGDVLEVLSRVMLVLLRRYQQHSPREESAGSAGTVLDNRQSVRHAVRLLIPPAPGALLRRVALPSLVGAAACSVLQRLSPASARAAAPAGVATLVAALAVAATEATAQRDAASSAGGCCIPYNGAAATGDKVMQDGSGAPVPTWLSGVEELAADGLTVAFYSKEAGSPGGLLSRLSPGQRTDLSARLRACHWPATALRLLRLGGAAAGWLGGGDGREGSGGGGGRGGRGRGVGSGRDKGGEGSSGSSSTESRCWDFTLALLTEIPLGEIIPLGQTTAAVKSFSACGVCTADSDLQSDVEGLLVTLGDLGLVAAGRIEDAMRTADDRAATVAPAAPVAEAGVRTVRGKKKESVTATPPAAAEVRTRQVAQEVQDAVHLYDRVLAAVSATASSLMVCEAEPAGTGLDGSAPGSPSLTKSPPGAQPPQTSLLLRSPPLRGAIAVCIQALCRAAPARLQAALRLIPHSTGGDGLSLTSSTLALSLPLRSSQALTRQANGLHHVLQKPVQQPYCTSATEGAFGATANTTAVVATRHHGRPSTGPEADRTQCRAESHAMDRSCEAVRLDPILRDALASTIQVLGWLTATVTSYGDFSPACPVRLLAAGGDVLCTAAAYCMPGLSYGLGDGPSDAVNVPHGSETTGGRSRVGTACVISESAVRRVRAVASDERRQQKADAKGVRPQDDVRQLLLSCAEALVSALLSMSAHPDVSEAVRGLMPSVGPVSNIRESCSNGSSCSITGSMSGSSCRSSIDINDGSSSMGRKSGKGSKSRIRGSGSSGDGSSHNGGVNYKRVGGHNNLITVATQRTNNGYVSSSYAAMAPPLPSTAPPAPTSTPLPQPPLPSIPSSSRTPPLITTAQPPPLSQSLTAWIPVLKSLGLHAEAEVVGDLLTTAAASSFGSGASTSEGPTRSEGSPCSTPDTATCDRSEKWKGSVRTAIGPAEVASQRFRQRAEVLLRQWREEPVRQSVQQDFTTVRNQSDSIMGARWQPTYGDDGRGGGNVAIAGTAAAASPSSGEALEVAGGSGAVAVYDNTSRQVSDPVQNQNLNPNLDGNPFTGGSFSKDAVARVLARSAAQVAALRLQLKVEVNEAGAKLGRLSGSCEKGSKGGVNGLQTTMPPLLVASTVMVSK